MSAILGIDYSTWAIDLVKLDVDTLRGDWTRLDLPPGIALERARRIPRPSSSYFDDVIMVATEEPRGMGLTTHFKLGRVQGVVLSMIPLELTVHEYQPHMWRRACNLPGNSTKEMVGAWARSLIASQPGIELWPQDAFDAYAMAYALLMESDRAAYPIRKEQP